MKHLLSKFLILLVFVIVLASSSSLAYSYFDSKTNSSSSSITIGEWMIGISTPQEFYDFATKSDSVSEDKYYLENDIDFSGFDWTLDANNNNVVFKGYLDGDNHTISNLTIYTNDGTYKNLGIFPIINGGTVKNLKLNNVETDIDDSVLDSNTYRSGLIAGQIKGTTIIDNITINNCGVRANRGTGAGGIVGYIYGTSTNVTITNIKATNLKIFNVKSNSGGIIGQINKDVPSVVVKDIDIQGDVFSYANSSYVGGIVGKIESNSGLTIQRAIIDITTQNTLETSQNYQFYSKKFIGGIIGYNDTSSSLLNISEVFVTGDLITQGSAKSKYVGTAIGRNVGTYTINNSYYSNIQFKHTDGNLYYSQEPSNTGVNIPVVNDDSMPSLSWWNNYFIDFDNGLWAQDSNGRPYLIR